MWFIKKPLPKRWLPRLHVRLSYCETSNRGWRWSCSLAFCCCVRTGGEERASKKIDLEKLLKGKMQIWRLNIHLRRVVGYKLLAVFCVVVPRSSFFPSLKKMSRCRVEAPVVLLLVSLLLLKPSRSVNLTRTQAGLPRFQRVPHCFPSTPAPRVGLLNINDRRLNRYFASDFECESWRHHCVV